MEDLSYRFILTVIFLLFRHKSMKGHSQANKDIYAIMLIIKHRTYLLVSLTMSSNNQILDFSFYKYKIKILKLMDIQK